MLLLRSRPVPASIWLSSAHHPSSWNELFVERCDSTLSNIKQAARVQAAVRRGGQHHQGRTLESPTQATENPMATLNMSGPSSTEVNLRTTDGSVAVANENPVVCRRLHAVFEDYSANELIVGTDLIPPDLFVQFDEIQTQSRLVRYREHFR